MQNLLDNPQALGLIVGVLLPLVTSVIQQPKLPKPAKVLIAVVAALIAGSVTVVIAGAFDPGNWVATVAAVLVAAQSSYVAIWKPSGVADAIESATSPKGDIVVGEVLESTYDGYRTTALLSDEIRQRRDL